MNEDYTKIPIQFDPRLQRMSGVTSHGNHYFSAPFMSKIMEDLWVGGCTTGLMLPTDIVHVVSLYPWEEYKRHSNVKSYHPITMYDSLSQDFDQVDEIAALVNECRADGPTLVHCQAGLNRSNLIAARALMLGDNMTAKDAIQSLRDKRSPAVLCNNHFEQWLLQK